MGDLRNLIGYLKGEIAEESEYLEEKNAEYANGHKGRFSRSYYTDIGIVEGMQKVREKIEIWCYNNGIDFDDIIEEEDDYS